VLGGGTVAALVLLQNGSETPSTPSLSVSGNSITTSGPWRLQIDGRDVGTGCRITLTDTRSGSTVPLKQPANGIYAPVQLQIRESGSFRWQTNNPGCQVMAIAGSGDARLPFPQESFGDSDAFAAPDRVSVHITDFQGNPGLRSAALRPIQRTAARQSGGTTWRRHCETRRQRNTDGLPE
jgi:hypothetical protein